MTDAPLDPAICAAIAANYTRVREAWGPSFQVSVGFDHALEAFTIRWDARTATRKYSETKAVAFAEVFFGVVDRRPYELAYLLDAATRAHHESQVDSARERGRGIDTYEILPDGDVQVSYERGDYIRRSSFGPIPPLGSDRGPLDSIRVHREDVPLHRFNLTRRFNGYQRRIGIYATAFGDAQLLAMRMDAEESEAIDDKRTFEQWLVDELQQGPLAPGVLCEMAQCSEWETASALTKLVENGKIEVVERCGAFIYSATPRRPT